MDSGQVVADVETMVFSMMEVVFIGYVPMDDSECAGTVE